MSCNIMENVVRELIAKEVGGTIRLIVSRINYEIKVAWGFKRELKKLKRQFTILSELSEGALGEPITNPLMVDWFKKIKNVANDANNLIDELSYDILKKQVINSSSRKRDKFKTTITYPLSRFRSSHKVIEMGKLISGIYSDAKELGIKPIKVAAGDAYTDIKQTLEIQNQQRTLMYQRQCVGDELIGRDKDRNQLVKWICDPTNDNTYLTVVGIVGLAGLGKTALSKQVSKATEVSACFDSLVICLVVSHSFDLIDCLNRMVEILFGENLNLRDRNALIIKLQLKLMKKKYLLILDDVWDTTFWEPLRMTLNEIGEVKGSAILVTSRDRSVVENMKTYKYGGEGKRTPGNKALIHQLQGLNECDSWSLFMARFNCGDDDDVSEDDLLLARKMIKSCKGVPLAIKALGDLLKDKSSEEWKKIEESEEWKKYDKHGILPSLRLSYTYLPNTALKKCFAYCGIFKEDEVIVKDKLIYMWMAHSLLEPFDGEIMESTGEKYCKVLLNRSLFQEAEMDDCGNIKTFKMHDLVLSLARVVSMGECLQSNGEHDGSTEVQHLSLPCFDKELTTKSCCLKLQTVFHRDKVDEEGVHQLKECRRLRVLRIRGFYNEKSMSKLFDNSFKHLRYLEIDFFHNYVENMEMMRVENVKLYHLQTLCIGHAFGESIWFLKGILMCHLVNLRHIHCQNNSIGIPEGLGRLSALETLPILDLEKNWGGRISELGSLKNLRGTLGLCNVKCINREGDASSLFSACGVFLKHIENLILIWGKSEALQQNRVLEAMQPHSNLRRLEIREYYGTIFPTWLTKAGSPLCNLVSLTLEDCPCVKGCLQMENFRYLRFLNINVCGKLRLSFPEHGFQCCKLLEELKVYKVNSSLPDLSPLTKLRVLLYSCVRELCTNELLPPDLDEHSPLCKSIQILTLDSLALPMQLQYLVTLQSLSIRCYDEVETIPEWLGNLVALRSLEFRYMFKLKWLPSQQAMQRLSNLHTFAVMWCPILEKDIYTYINRLKHKSREKRFSHASQLEFGQSKFSNGGTSDKVNLGLRSCFLK